MADTAEHSPAVTRIEIIDAIEVAFAEGPVTKQQIITAASQDNARDLVLAALDNLPERSYGHVRGLWDYLPDIPIEL